MSLQTFAARPDAAALTAALHAYLAARRRAEQLSTLAAAAGLLQRMQQSLKSADENNNENNNDDNDDIEPLLADFMVSMRRNQWLGADFVLKITQHLESARRGMGLRRCTCRSHHQQHSRVINHGHEDDAAAFGASNTEWTGAGDMAVREFASSRLKNHSTAVKHIQDHLQQQQTSIISSNIDEQRANPTHGPLLITILGQEYAALLMSRALRARATQNALSLISLRGECMDTTTLLADVEARLPGESITHIVEYLVEAQFVIGGYAANAVALIAGQEVLPVHSHPRWSNVADSASQISGLTDHVITPCFTASTASLGHFGLASC